LSVGLQPWLNEEDRQAALVEKHRRGEAARKIRAGAKAKTKHSHLRSKGWCLVKCVPSLFFPDNSKLVSRSQSYLLSETHIRLIGMPLATLF
jgi:hypothetical protein